MTLTVNQKIGKLKMLEKIKEVAQSRSRIHWLCRCDCGTEKRIRQDNIVMGMSRSCGCGHKAQKSNHIGAALSAPWGVF